MGTRLVFRLAGEDARLGRADAVDVAHLILGANSVMRRTAAVLAGRRPGSRGRLPRQIADAVRLHLCGISEGSLVVEFELPDAPDESDALDLDDAPLGETTARTAFAVLEGSETGFPETTTAWNQLANDLDIGGRNDSLTLNMPSHAQPPAVLDESARARLAAASQRENRDDEAGERVGVLFEADFEKNTACLRTAEGTAVAVKFDEEQAALIKEALRERTRLRGHITYSERTSEAVAVDLVEILRADQLVLGVPVTDFWTTRSVAELAEEQGVTPVVSIDELRDDTISEHEAKAFMEALGL
ncbi:MAG: hypothetical protein F4Z53_15170 [Acidimicrobiales bacterium]|nr:hypothetical protein [Acidimicrobiaceae bacterium]MDE0676518.1 hypothetical protein [Acidimicrobiaceae bacterium]MXX44380.1 hypothetical protein [Acidimicrobiales bacterium]MYD32510.1 hypothetical protein [Acidimicrobiales bacterium]MYI08992.1 hypothetical protein [Acidimicrobiales bacterium]